MVGAEYYSAVAQVIPVLVLAVALQTQDVAIIAERRRDRRSRADAASRSFIAAVKAMADGRRPIAEASRYEQMQFTQALRLDILNKRDTRRLAPLRWAILAGGLSETLALAALRFGVAWWPVDIGVSIGLAGCALVLGLLMWTRMGGRDLLDGSRWSRDPFPEVTDEQARGHQQLLDFLNQALATGILTEANLEQILTKYESEKTAAEPEHGR